MIYHKQEHQRLKEEILLLEKELSLLPDFDNSDPVIPFYRFKTRKRVSTEKKKYFDLQRQLSNLRTKLTEISKDLSPEEFKKLVREGKIVLTEEDKIPLYNSSKFNSISELCLVHKCDYMPYDNEIKSSLSSGGESIRSFLIGDKSYDYKHKEQRHTVHFAVNGEVGSHDMGNWDIRKYAIIVPFECLLDEIISACSCDTFIRDRALLNDQCYILCPKGEEEKVKELNNMVNIIPYEGKNVSGFANAVISFLGYKCERVSNHEWIGDDQYSYESLMRKHNLNMREHMATKDYSYELMKKSYNHILEIYSRLLMPDVEIDSSTFKSMQADQYGDNVYSNLRFHISQFIEGTNACNELFSKDKTIQYLIIMLNDLTNINPNFKFETDFSTLKSKYFVHHYDPVDPFIKDVLKVLFNSVIEKRKKHNINTNEENKSNSYH